MSLILEKMLSAKTQKPIANGQGLFLKFLAIFGNSGDFGNLFAHSRDLSNGECLAREIHPFQGTLPVH
jgi:hypothetical protein